MYGTDAERAQSGSVERKGPAEALQEQGWGCWLCFVHLNLSAERRRRGKRELRRSTSCRKGTRGPGCSVVLPRHIDPGPHGLGENGNCVVRCLPGAACLPRVRQERKKLLTFVVVGGGPTGVEVAAELYDMIEEDLAKLYPNIIKDVSGRRGRGRLGVRSDDGRLQYARVGMGINGLLTHPLASERALLRGPGTGGRVESIESGPGSWTSCQVGLPSTRYTRKGCGHVPACSRRQAPALALTFAGMAARRSTAPPTTSALTCNLTPRAHPRARISVGIPTHRFPSRSWS